MCVYITVKTQFDNTSTYDRVLIILTLHLVAMLDHAFGPPSPFRNSGSAPVS